MFEAKEARRQALECDNEPILWFVADYRPEILDFIRYEMSNHDFKIAIVRKLAQLSNSS